jgi:Uma2 family endonuclease
MTAIESAVQPKIVYPESDGQPMADNTKQFRWIVTIEGGLDALFKNDPNVFVAGDLLWYPVEGQPTIRMAPDAMVVFGRPKGDRGSYQQWREAGIAPQVVFEVLSPGNRVAEMIKKFQFYDRYQVEEYYIYDPDRGDLNGWARTADGDLIAIDTISGWISPRMGVRFDLVDGELELYYPDGRKFASYIELAEQAAQARQQAEQAQDRAERLAAQLRALGIEPE